MSELNFNIFNVIILLGIIHGLIFGAILLLNKKLKSKTNVFLALTVFSLALSNLQYFLKDVGVDIYLNYIPFIPFEFLMLPFFYFFVKSYLGKVLNTKEVIILLSFFPFFIVYQYIFNESFFNAQFIELLNLCIEYLSLIYSLILIIVIFKIIINYESKNKESTHNIKIATKWLRQTLIIGMFLCILWFVSLNLFENLIVQKGYYQYYPLWIGISILIYWIGYASIIQSNIYFQRKALKKEIGRSKKPIILKGTNLNSNIDKIENAIDTEKKYLDPYLSLDLLSNDLNLSVSLISKSINTYKKMSFRDYINKLRLEEAKKLLRDTNYNNYTITAIALECGFSSKSAFYRAFKKQYNTTPSEFRKE
ncbi:helix-turn-helix domain-containing protein [Winogradskyella sp.]|uniref:helix-turn-helix domain-containing protein n=1 Tax=Winogradskyella sp. TaxID=1883156 RepID=UPI003BAB058A